VEGYVEHYNNARLNSAIGYITQRTPAGDSSRAGSEVGRAAKEQRKNHRQGGGVMDETDCSD
jgi:hypothetical protein